MKNLTKTLLSYLASAMPATATSARCKLKLALGCLLFFFASCDSKLSDFQSQQVQLALSDSLFTLTESWDFDMEIIEDGQRRLHLSGSYALTIQNEHEHNTRIKGPVHIRIFDDNGRIDTIVDADSAVYHPGVSEFEMFGNIKVQAPEGKMLYSDYLKWQRILDRVSTPEFVIFISPPDSIAANGFVGNTNLTNYTLNEGGGRVIIN